MYFYFIAADWKIFSTSCNNKYLDYRALHVLKQFVLLRLKHTVWNILLK